jgi:2-polyprenyl-3-methyl-5-hydroxy-6-metoxy-1,4-benzoquinol methylase
VSHRTLLAPEGVELLDDPDADPSDVRQSLENIVRANRWFGGWWAVRSGLRRVLPIAAPGTDLTLLDIGAGAGDLARWATRWSAGRGIRLRPIGLERNPTAAAVARQAALPMVLGCCGALPIRSRSVDLVLVSQVAHHLAPESVVRLLRECDRIARVGVVIADLRRSAVAEVAFWVGARLLRFDPATKADGLTSIRRGFSGATLLALTRAAGVRAQVCHSAGYRLVATWRPERKA